MRVTKIIREYVEKTVTAKMPYGEPTQANHEACAKMETLRHQVNEQVVEYATKLCEEVNAQLPEGFKISLYGHTPITKTNYGSPCRWWLLHTKEKSVRNAYRPSSRFW